MEKLDNVRIGKAYHGFCPIDINKIIEKRPDKIIFKSSTDLVNYKNIALKIYKDSYDKKSKTKQAHIRLEFGHYHSKDISKIAISNSLRKWYFGSNSTQDFNKQSLYDCLRLIAKFLCIDIEELFQFNIYRLELGVTFKLPPEYKLILNQLSGHKEYKKNGQFGNCGSVYFNGENTSIICYDVLQKMSNKNEISKNVVNKISEKYFFLRVELKINKRSTINFANEYIYTIKDLVENNEIILNYWIDHMLNIDIAEEIISIEDLIKLKDITPKDYIEFTSAKFIEIITQQKANATIDLAIKNNPKKKYAIKSAVRKNQKRWSVNKKASNNEIFKNLIQSVRK